MRRGKSVIGKDVLSLEDGQKLETVRDVVVDPDARSVVALVVDEGGFLSSSEVVPITEVVSFGRDAVMVRARESVVSVGDYPELRALVDREEKLVGKTVYTVEGNKQGTIGDVYFEEQTGRIVGYEVSGGLVGDFAKGTSYLSADELSTMGPELVYVQPETAEALESQKGGVQGAIAGAAERLGTARDGASQRIAEAGNAAKASASQARPEDALVGRRTGSDVEADDGEVIVPRGRRVSPDDLIRAREQGKLRALTASVAAGDAETAAADAKDVLGDAGDTAGSLWDQFTGKISEMTDATGRRIDLAQTKQRLADIEDAIGRPVTKVILDRKDDVILNFGDIITHQAIQRAYESGGLDSLLRSVHRGPIELSKAEMRASVAAAEATVERASGGAGMIDDLERQVETAEQDRRKQGESKRQTSEAERERRAREREERRLSREADRREREAAAAERPTRVADSGAAPDRSDERTATTARGRAVRH